MSEKNHIQWFRQASPYINKHRGKTFVLMLGGDAVASQNLPNIIEDIALLNSLGVRIVIAFGCRPQLTAALKDAGLSGDLNQGNRITTTETLNKLEYAMAHNRLAIESLFSTGNSNVKVCSGNFVTARPTGIINGVDLQSTGSVRKINHDAIHTLLDNHFVVLLGSIGFSITGERFNLTAENIASETAIALQADKLIFFTEEDGIYQQGQLLRELSSEQAKNVDGENSCIPHAVHACEGGVPRSHVINFNHNGALLQELFTRDGHGTLISNQGFEQLRPATLDDITGILSLVKPLEEKDILVTRSKEILEAQHQEFTVIERDGSIIACSALHAFSENNSGELACIVTHPDYQKSDRGSRLLQAIESQAKNLGLKELFVLTTQTEHWFLENGFTETSIETLPLEKQQSISANRGAKVLCKKLA